MTTSFRHLFPRLLPLPCASIINILRQLSRLVRCLYMYVCGTTQLDELFVASGRETACLQGVAMAVNGCVIEKLSKLMGMLCWKIIQYVKL